MRRIILRMIAAGSLSAFSTAATSVVPGVRAPAPPLTPVPLTPIRSPALPTAPAQPLTWQSPGDAKPPAPMPGRILPRGSLLDLSV